MPFWLKSTPRTAAGFRERAQFFRQWLNPFFAFFGLLFASLIGLMRAGETGAFFWAGVGLWGAVLLAIVELSRRAYNDIIRYDHCESEEKQ